MNFAVMKCIAVFDCITIERKCSRTIKELQIKGKDKKELQAYFEEKTHASSFSTSINEFINVTQFCSTWFGLSANIFYGSIMLSLVPTFVN